MLKEFEVAPYNESPRAARWTPDGQALVFFNWRGNAHNLWRQPLSGGSPEPLTDFTSGAIWNFVYSRDGERIVLSRGTTFIDLVLIKNFR